MVGLIGKKLGQTRVFDEEGNLVCVTVVQAGPNYVLQCKTPEKDGYSAVQLGFDAQKPQRLTKPLRGHLEKHGGHFVRQIREFRNFSEEVQPGQELGPDLFVPGDFVDAIGLTKGRGFQGVVKRYNFGGGGASHGAAGWHRRPGAIAQGTWPGHVRKGTQMPGHMGQRRRTVQNLEVIRVDAEEGLLLIKGAVPGANGDYLIIREAKKRDKAKAEARRQAIAAAKKAAEEARAKAKAKGRGRR
jgi:large subunit ribosomal protein L3